jgi:hypothetical protein
MSGEMDDGDWISRCSKCGAIINSTLGSAGHDPKCPLYQAPEPESER